jgi:hypothetical protein
MKTQTEIVVTGEIDIAPAADLQSPRVPRRNIGEVPPQMVPAQLIEEGPISAFASIHDPVLAANRELYEQPQLDVCYLD